MTYKFFSAHITSKLSFNQFVSFHDQMNEKLQRNENFVIA